MDRSHPAPVDDDAARVRANVRQHIRRLAGARDDTSPLNPGLRLPILIELPTFPVGSSSIWVNPWDISLLAPVHGPVSVSVSLTRVTLVSGATYEIALSPEEISRRMRLIDEHVWCVVREIGEWRQDDDRGALRGDIKDE